MFKRKGLIVYEASKIDDFDSFFELALENGAEDITNEDGVIEVTSSMEDFIGLKDALDKTEIEADVCELRRRCQHSPMGQRRHPTVHCCLQRALERGQPFVGVRRRAVQQGEDSGRGDALVCCLLPRTF